ncbi:TPA: StdB protein [Klebsiella pneumoniae]|nr:StdB protein [Klebsiella pneumoniae]
MAKVVILNYNGSVGKTLTATYVFKPRMPNARFFALETINMSASDLGVKDVVNLKGDNVGELIEEIVFEDEAIVDIGASNIERFLEGASKYENALQEFDCFVIPVTPDDKAWQESIKTAVALSKAGIKKDKIIFLPNRIKTTPEEDIDAVYDWVKEKKLATIHPKAFIYDSEIFEYLAFHKMSFEELLSEDAETFKLKAKETTDPEQRQAAARRYRWMKLAAPVQRNLDTAFAVLTGA